ncbi:hypothetical protein C8Q73DRAFT_794354 [Cubamyces lactineus]|nr:hypothetical protein C8Q73DRAFT_794354 [Cubamyces lactineus]
MHTAPELVKLVNLNVLASASRRNSCHLRRFGTVARSSDSIRANRPRSTRRLRSRTSNWQVLHASSHDQPSQAPPLSTHDRVLSKLPIIRGFECGGHAIVPFILAEHDSAAVDFSCSQLDTAALLRPIAMLTFLAAIQYPGSQCSSWTLPRPVLVRGCGASVGNPAPSTCTPCTSHFVLCVGGRSWRSFVATSGLPISAFVCSTTLVSVARTAFALVRADSPNTTLPPWQAWTPHAPESPFDRVSDLVVRPLDVWNLRLIGTGLGHGEYPTQTPPSESPSTVHQPPGTSTSLKLRLRAR